MYEVGTVLRYRCHPGYKTTGNKPMTVTCQENFEWTPYEECEGEFLFLKYFSMLNVQHVLGFSTLNDYNCVPQVKFMIILIQPGDCYCKERPQGLGV